MPVGLKNKIEGPEVIFFRLGRVFLSIGRLVTNGRILLLPVMDNNIPIKIGVVTKLFIIIRGRFNKYLC